MTSYTYVYVYHSFQPLLLHVARARPKRYAGVSKMMQNIVTTAVNGGAL